MVTFGLHFRSVSLNKVGFTFWSDNELLWSCGLEWKFSEKISFELTRKFSSVARYYGQQSWVYYKINFFWFTIRCTRIKDCEASLQRA
jgi:hypothetical protein